MRVLRRIAGALAAFGRAVRDYVVEPLEGAVRNHVSPIELLDVVLAALASGGATNVLLALAADPRYLHGLTTTQVSIYASTLTLIARLVQRYTDGDHSPPVRPA